MHRLNAFVAGVSVASLLLTPLAAHAADAEPQVAPTSPTVDSPQLAPPEEFVKVIIMLDNQPSRPGGELLNLREVNRLRDRLVAKYGIKPDRSFGHLLKGFSAEIPADKWTQIEAEAQVGSVEQVREYEPLMGTAGDLTYSTQAREDFGVSGEGTVIAIIDTGVDMHHQDMKLDPGVKKKLEPAEGFNDKVPWGYNYADDNTEVKDLTPIQHGQHVAGIAAANGGSDADPLGNGRITGIAPNAQILGLKVFPNARYKGGGASSEDIIAAIEDAHKHGADIINMSLGQASGFSGPTAGEHRAIQMVTAEGTEVVVAAGNDGLAWDPGSGISDQVGMFDDGVHGSPATSVDALAVASVDNSVSIASAGQAQQGDRVEKIIYQPQGKPTDGQAHTIVFGGYGTADEIPDTAQGNYVLIERGAPEGQSITFRDKFEAAVGKGATGVIIFNHEKGGEEISNMSRVDEFGIFGVMIPRSNGLTIKEMIATGDTQVTFTEEHVGQQIASVRQPSSFSSWGPPTSLEFKPQLAGIGGFVWSTLSDDKYANSSGTSMASPHVAGATALVLESSRQKYPGLESTELNRRNRIALTNTAQILANAQGVPFSPRQMGAGLINTRAAIETDVYASVDGSPWVALREVEQGESFTVTLENFGSQDRTYAISATCAVNETNVKGEDTTTFCNDKESLKANVQSVTVPAGGSAQVTFTVTTDTSSTHWFGAWAMFEAADPSYPTLSVPTMGFVGDWNAEPIFDQPEPYESLLKEFNPEEAVTGRTALTTKTSPWTKATSNGTPLWFSPNGDGSRDTIMPHTVLLRNAETITGRILDKEGNELRQVGVERFVPRMQLSNFGGSGVMGRDLQRLTFDGTIYNTKTGKFEPLKEGVYTYRLEGKIEDSYAEQRLDMDFEIDLTPPTATFGPLTVDDQGFYNITIEAADSYSGIGRVYYPTGFLNSGVAAKETDTPGQYHLRLPPAITQLRTDIPVIVADAAGNSIQKVYPLSQGPVVLDDAQNWKSDLIGVTTESQHYGGPVVVDGQRRVSGTVDPKVTSLTINGQAVTITDGAFETTIPVKDNVENTVVFKAVGDGVDWEETKTFVYDAEAPKLTFENMEFDEASGHYITELDEHGVLNLIGSASDNLTEIDYMEMHLPGQFLPNGFEVIDGRFELHEEIPPFFGVIVFGVSDGANETTYPVRITNAQVSPDGQIVFSDLATAAINVATPQDKSVTREDGQWYYTWTGRLSLTPSRFVVAGKDVEFNPITGEFTTKFPIDQGINPILVTLYDAKGDKMYDTSLKVFFDTIMPTFELEDGKPALGGDGAIYLKEAGDVQFKGSVVDNAFGYTMALNGNIISSRLSLFDPGPEANQGVFDATVKAEDGDLLLLGLYDAMGNFVERQIPVVVDDTTPEVSLTGITQGQKFIVREQDAQVTQTVTVRARDPHLANLRVTLDGTPVEHRVVKAVPHPRSAFIRHGQDAEGNYYEGAGSIIEPNPPWEVSFNADSQPSSAQDTDTQAADDQEAAGAVAAARAEFVEAHKDSAAEGSTGPDAQTAETEFDVTIEVKAGVGKHMLTTEVADKAGNVNLQAIPFAVDYEPLVDISGTAELLTGDSSASGVTLTATGLAPQGTKFTVSGEAVDGKAVFTASSPDFEFEATYTLSTARKIDVITVTYSNGETAIVTPTLGDGTYAFKAASNLRIEVSFAPEEPADVPEPRDEAPGQKPGDTPGNGTPGGQTPGGSDGPKPPYPDGAHTPDQDKDDKGTGGTGDQNGGQGNGKGGQQPSGQDTPGGKKPMGKKPSLSVTGGEAGMLMALSMGMLIVGTAVNLRRRAHR